MALSPSRIDSRIAPSILEFHIQYAARIYQSADHDEHDSSDYQGVNAKRLEWPSA